MSFDQYRNNGLPKMFHSSLSGCMGSGTALVSEAYVVVRFAPERSSIILPYGRASCLQTLIPTLLYIYNENNPDAQNPHGPFKDVLSYISIYHDGTNSQILPHMYADFVQPRMRIAVKFAQPFRPPPWNVGDSNMEDTPTIKQEQLDDDVEMSEEFGHSLETKLNAYQSTMENNVCKQEGGINVLNNDFIPTPAMTTPASSFSLRSGFTASMAVSKASIENIVDTSTVAAGTLLSPVSSDCTSFSRPNVTERSLDYVNGTAASSEPVGFTNPFAATNYVNAPSAMPPNHFSPSTLSHLPTPSSSSSSVPTLNSSNPRDTLETPPATPFNPADGKASHYHTRSKDANPRPSKRKRGPMKEKTSNGSLRARSRSPACSSSEISSNATSRDVSVSDSDFLTTMGKPIARPKSRMPSSAPNGVAQTIVLVQKALLLDTIKAGEHIKIIKTKEGDIVAVRNDEEPEAVMARRLSNATQSSEMDRKELEADKARTIKKRPLEEADTLVRIWSGLGVDPPKKKSKANPFDKLSTEHKSLIAKFVKDQHIIRIDHFTAPAIEEWKQRNVPDADDTQTNEYIQDIASTIYNTNERRQNAYRTFMEHHDHSHRSQQSTPAPL